MKKSEPVNVYHSRWGCSFLVIITLLVYYPTLKNGFLTGWDDQWMVFSRYTEGGWTVDNLWHIFTDFYGGQYAPLAFLSYLALYTGFGYDSFYYHLFSLLLHIGCVCLVWRFVVTLLCMHDKMGKKKALMIASFTAFLFAIHPVNVESVAWMGAVKILLYSFFYLSGALFYLRYIQTLRKTSYLMTLFCFLFSFWGKEQAITFPLFLLMIDWFLDRDLKSGLLWVEKMPFFIMALFGGFITILSQGYGSGGTTTYPFMQRIVFVCYSLIEYLTKGLLPIRLNYLYPFPFLPGEAMPVRLYIYLLICFSLGGCLWAYRKRRYLLLGVCLFIINLLFSIHLIPMSRHAITADRYLYLSYVGIAFLLAYALVCLYRKWRKCFYWALPVAVAYCVYLSVYTFTYTRRWKDTPTLKRYMKELIEKRPDYQEDPDTINNLLN